MRKSLLFLLCMSISVAIFAKTPKISAPGFKKHNTEIESKKTKAQAKHSVPVPVKFANAPQQYVMMAEETETKGIRLLKTYAKEIEKYNDNYERISENEYTYDKYGFFHKRQNLKLDEYSLVEYKWFVPGWKWSEKVDTWYYKTGGTVYDRTSAIKRTFYANGSVRTSRNYDNGNLENEQIFDENGNLIEIIEGDYKKKYTYFPYLDEWLESTFSPYEIKEYTVYDNYFKVTNTVLINDQWMLRRVQEYYFDKKKQQCGNLDIYYNDEGKVSSAYGYKNVITEENANEVVSGYFNFNQETMEWEQSSKVIRSANYDNPWIYKEGETRFEKYYYRYSIDEELTLQYEENYSWIKEDIVKEATTEYNGEGKSYSYNNYYLVENKELSDDIYYDEKTGNYGTYDYIRENDKEYDIYSYFDAAGKLVSKIRVCGLVWEQWDGSKWITCTGEVTVYEGSDYYVAKFNDKGQLIQLTEYEDGLFESREDYVYIPNGFERNTWEYKEGTTELYLYEFYTYTLANDVETVIMFEYDEDGTIDYSYKHEEFIALGYVVIYHYEDNKWVERERSALSIYEELPDGKQVNIQRTIDEQGKVVNVSKEIYTYSEDEYNYREYYRWDTESNSWIGEYKSESGRIEIPEFKVIQPAQPTYFYDEYFIPANMIEESSAQPNHLYFYYNWVWSIEKNDWIMDYGSDTKFVIDGNTLTTVYTDYYSGGDYYVSTTKQTVDSNRRLLSYSTESKHSYDNDTETEYKRYVYDADGRLVEKEDDDISRNRTYKYTYGEITFISEVENVITDASDYILNGRILTVTNDTSAEVYNMQGVKVAVISDGGSVELSGAGVYIIKIADKASKIAVK